MGQNHSIRILSLFEDPLVTLFNSLVQFSSVAQLCPTLCHPMNCSTPGLPVHHQLPEFTQTHVHRVGDAIQPSHPLSSLLLLPPVSPSIRVFSSESLVILISVTLSFCYLLLEISSLFFVISYFLSFM